MSEPHQFRHYLIVQDAEGSNVELERSAEKVTVLAFDTVRLEFVACHVMLHPLAEKIAFEETCRRLRGHGHPLLARMVDFGEDEGNPFYITGAADGEPLRAYLNRQQELPGWLAVMLASRALDAAAAVCSRGDCLPQQPLNSLRVVQVGTQSLVVIASDYRLTPTSEGTAARNRSLRANFDKQGKFLRAFLLEQSGGSPTLPDHPLSAADFTELLAGCLDAAGPVAVPQMMELRNSLQKLAPEHLSGEIPAPQKPRALIAPLLASYQDVARAVVNRVRIQSQRLDMTNPYSMRGTLTKAGRPVLVEQIPPSRVVGRRLQEAAVQLQKLTRKNDHPHLATVAMVHEADAVICLAEEIVEGISLAELLRERGGLEVQEAYLVLAGLDSALADLDSTHLPTQKLRLEDLFLLIGGSREDPRSAKLLKSKLNDWPSFSVVLRAHTCLASMAGRGTDPGLLLPPGATTSAEVSTRWHGGWMAAAGRFLLGIENPVGASLATVEVAKGRERETVEKLLEDEIARTIEGRPSSRAEFLSRFARIVHHYDVVKPIAAVKTAPITEVRSSAKTAQTPAAPAAVAMAVTAPLRRIEEEEVSPVEVTLPGGAIGSALGGMALTQGFSTPKPDKPNVGFAEILFTGGSDELTPPDEPDWARRQPAGGAMPPHFDVPRDPTPIWLKAAVFLLGSMALGGTFAHLSGDALWQRFQKDPPRPLEVLEDADPSNASAATDLKKLAPTANVPPQTATEPEPPGVTLRSPPASSLKSKLVE
jgi:hypothetical protein